jgi:hypothetical protein
VTVRDEDASLLRLVLNNASAKFYRTGKGLSREPLPKGKTHYG